MREMMLDFLGIGIRVHQTTDAASTGRDEIFNLRQAQTLPRGTLAASQVLAGRWQIFRGRLMRHSLVRGLSSTGSAQLTSSAYASPSLFMCASRSSHSRPTYESLNRSRFGPNAKRDQLVLFFNIHVHGVIPIRLRCAYPVRACADAYRRGLWRVVCFEGVSMARYSALILLHTRATTLW